MSTLTKPLQPKQSALRAALATLGRVRARLTASPSLPVAVVAVTAAVSNTACFSCGPLAPPRMPSAAERA